MAGGLGASKQVFGGLGRLGALAVQVSFGGFTVRCSGGWTKDAVFFVFKVRF